MLDFTVLPGNNYDFTKYRSYYVSEAAPLCNIRGFIGSNNPDTLAYARQKWHLPQAVIIPLAITVRYFPTLHEEQQAISDAMKLRNVHGVFQKLEYIYVPLMLSASTTADELSQAITARGIDNPRPKTCAVSMRFHIQDYVLCFVAIVLVIIAFVLL